MTNSGATTWWGFVRAVLAEAGADPERVHAISILTAGPAPALPRGRANLVLDNLALRLNGLPPAPWQDGLSRLVSVLRAEGAG